MPGSSTTLASPRRATHPVGVARQDRGQLGKQDNCQIAVVFSGHDHASLPICLSAVSARGMGERFSAKGQGGVPEDFVFHTKPKIALDQIRLALAAGVPAGTVLADAGYGNDTAFRSALTEIGLSYVVGIQSSASLRPPR